MKYKNTSASYGILFKSALIALLMGMSFISRSQIISTFAGNYNEGGGYSGDGGPATVAELYAPAGVAVDASGNVYIADSFNSLIRKVNTSGIISTFAGIAIGASSGDNEGYSGDGGPATAAELYYPFGVAVDISGNVYIADFYNSLIRKVNTSGIISTFAGNYNDGSGYSGDGGPATVAQLNYPTGVAIDSSGNVYIADYFNRLIRKVNTLGIINTFAGNYNGGGGYSGGGPATATELDSPSGVAVDASGNVYIADQSVYSLILKVDTSGIISTFAGNYNDGSGYFGDGGPATAAELNYPAGIAVDASWDVYIADENNNLIRTVNTSGIISTFAGNYFEGGGYSGDGASATFAQLNSPAGIAVDAFGNVYIADGINNVIRKVTYAFYVSVTNVSCKGESNGSASISSYFSDRSPYAYSWSPNGGTNSTVTGLSAGTYTITVTDNHDSTASAEVIITQPIAISTSVSVTTNVSCNGGNNGSASATFSGGTSPYTYSWSGGGGANSTASGLSAGTYTVTVSDSCSSSATASVTITQPPGMTFSHDSVSATLGCNGIASITPSGGTTPYTYSWSFGQTTDTIKALCANSYCCTITDNNGCSQTTCITVKSATGIDNISNSSTITIYPNPTTGQFTISGLQKGMILEMYDYTGKIISSTTSTNQAMELNISQADGVYLIRILDKDGNLVTEKKVVKTQ